jgi:flagellar basal-body rod protein FlgG
VKTPEGIRYTRKGNFTLDREGTLITQDGYQVLGKGGPITIEGTHINADGSGNILVDGAQAGQLDLVDFDRPKLLMKDGNGQFMMTDGVRQTPPPTQTMISQGYVELSNVEVAEEMVQMIHSLRAFESYQKIIQILDGVNQRAINEVSRVH